MSKRRGVSVVGSVHMDLIAVADRLPESGGSLLGNSFSMQPGGKGANQAAQVALMGERCTLIGRVGADHFGEVLTSSLASTGVDTEQITIDSAVRTGASPILVGADGEYASIIVPGAAALLAGSDIDHARNVIADSAILMLQLELPVDVSIHAADVAHRAGTVVVLNASPILTTPVPARLWSFVDILVVNLHEAKQIGAIYGEMTDSPVSIVETLHDRFDLDAVVITLGREGALAYDGSTERHVPSWTLPVVDTVGAGDAFVGALAANLARGQSLMDALPFAVAAGALAVTRSGGFAGFASREAVEQLVASRSDTPHVS